MTDKDAPVDIDFDAPRAWRIRVSIADIEPPIWRTLLVPESLNFAQLHEVIQAAFGWTDSHLHQFIVGGLVIGAAELLSDDFDDRRTLEATEFRLSDLVLYHFEQPAILYEYDFGNSWNHWIVFEDQVRVAKGETWPTLLDGARSRPPEDVGGPPGYERFLEAWRDPAHDDHRAMRTWAGRAFHPEAFNLEKTQKAIRAALRKCKGDYRFRIEP